MVFTSPIFMFYFLPFFFLAYGFALAVKKLSFGAMSFWLCNLVILLFSLAFYYWGENNAVLVLLGVILLNYAAAFFLVPGGGRSPSGRKTALIVCVAANLLCLLVFKYAGFAAELFVSATGWNIPAPRVSLPLGISFFIFQAMSYVVDVYRGKVVANRSFVGYAAYIAMFPQLVAGPIVRYADIAAQLDSRSVGSNKFALGVERFIFGLAKKVLIANHVAVFADRVFGMQPERVTPELAWAGVLCYAIQIYFDFSGYSDMAIGLGKMIGFDFRENFLHPYSAVSMQDFWRRWHISLSSWFRDYLYIPLGGNRKGNARTYVNLFIVFLLCGLWHGAAVNFILWGAYHGAFLVFERIAKPDFSRRRLVGRVYTLIAVLFGWVLFRSESAEQAVRFVKAMLCLGDFPMRIESRYDWLWFSLDVKAALAIGCILSFPLYDRLRAKTRDLAGTGAGSGTIRVAAGQVLRLAVSGCLLAASLVPLIGDSYNPFIYFRF